MTWAILSGIEGNLAAYEAVLNDLEQQRSSIEQVFILGDVIGPTPHNLELVNRIRSPKPGALVPAVCQGWWEEQALILYALGRREEPTELVERYGNPMITTLWEAVPRELTPWISQLEFGFMELDCLMIHGTPAGVEEALTPETSPLVMIDRLQRVQANRMFCGRSGLSFCFEIESGQLNSQLQTLDRLETQRAETQQAQRPSLQQVIGVGSVGRSPTEASYVLYEPGSDRLQFKTVDYC
ncbi:MAG: metallophosphatase [Synechococcales cyanobacterium RU_4_20]|nr:metallophosphatase [Synechococcales cyanobacterium RU_4_20]NJR68600.1 metallophosphatase [Synechococcales cyanobacterium CRU_2_2]